MVWMGRPSKTTSPEAGRRIPEMVRRMVDLPAPLAPMRATISPSLTRKETSQITWTSP